MYSTIKNLILSLTLFIPILSYALSYPMPTYSNIEGQILVHQVSPGETLTGIAHMYHTSIERLKEHNPILRKKGLRSGQELIINQMVIFPTEIPEHGILINLPENRLYFHNPRTKTIDIYPVGVGRKYWETPTMKATIQRKKIDPIWYPPDSIRAHYERKNKPLKAYYLPGPNNPLGTRALYLSYPRIIIHGNNQPHLIGGDVSSGCIRMFNEHVEQLYEDAPQATKVHIIDQPYKIGVKDGLIYVSVFKLYKKYVNIEKQIMNKLDQLSQLYPYLHIDYEQLHYAVDTQLGKPIRIGFTD